MAKARRSRMSSAVSELSMEFGAEVVGVVNGLDEGGKNLAVIHHLAIETRGAARLQIDVLVTA